MLPACCGPSLDLLWVVEDWEEPGAGGAPGSSQRWGDLAVRVAENAMPTSGIRRAVAEHFPSRSLDAVQVHPGGARVDAQGEPSTVGFCGDGSGGCAYG